MKKHILITALLLCIAMLFTGCSGKSASGTMYNGMADSAAAVEEAYYETSYNTTAYADYDYKSDDIGGSDAGLAQGAAGSTVNLAEKIIYTANSRVETTDFENSLQTLYRLVEECGGFFENSSVSGNNYSYNSLRHASFTIRVPKEQYSRLTGDLSALGNVMYVNSDTQNITGQFMDSEARMKSYKTEEARLLEILEKAETVDEMITIEYHLADVRYNIESIQSRLNGWQNQVDYSTVNLSLDEVKELTEEAPQTYGQEIAAAVKESLEFVADFFKGLVKYAIAALPLIPVFAVIVLIAWLIIKLIKLLYRKNAGSREEKKLEKMRKKQEKAERKAQKKADKAEK